MIPIIAAGIAAAGGIIGKILGDMSEADAQRLIEQSMDATGKIDVPTLQGLTAQEVGPSAMESIRTDPRLRDAQMGTLERLRQMYDQGGMDLEDRANLNRISSQTGRAASASRNAIQSQMDARGMGNSGASLMLQQKAAQDQAQNAQQAGLDVAGQAMRRRLQALSEQGKMAGDIRGQEFGEQSSVAQARDAVARYNAQARTAAGQYRNQMTQQNYQNTLAKQAQMNGLAASRASGKSQEAANTQGFWGGLGDTAQGAINGYGQMKEKTAARDWQADQDEKDRRAYGSTTRYT